MWAWNINQIMALSINTNIASITTQRHLNKSRAELNTAMERLSSGKRINSAKDDAAGLAISQKMTAQIEGLRQAVRNSNDAISLAQTAEGAMEEITNILQRMRTLSVQAINDTNSSTDRQALNNEVVELKAEINRIANTSAFNNIPLLKDGYSGTFQIGHKAGQTIDLELNDASTSSLGAYTTHASTSPTMVNIDGGYSASMDLSSLDGSNGFRLDGVDADDYSGKSVSNAGDINNDGYDDVIIGAHTADPNGANSGESYVVFGKPNTPSGTLNFNNLNLVEGDRITLSITGGTQVQGVVGSDGLNTILTSLASSVASQTSLFSGASASGGVLTLNALTSGAALVNVTVTLESGANSLANSSILTASNAANALSAIDTSISDINSQRSILGAFQNRLEHAISNLSNMAINTESARSKILDTDYAVETSRLAKNQILQQVGIAMLAQANATKELVISLLRNLTH